MHARLADGVYGEYPTPVLSLQLEGVNLAATSLDRLAQALALLHAGVKNGSYNALEQIHIR